jgi:hypothetical protein
MWMQKGLTFAFFWESCSHVSWKEVDPLRYSARLILPRSLQLITLLWPWYLPQPEGMLCDSLQAATRHVNSAISTCGSLQAAIKFAEWNSLKRNNSVKTTLTEEWDVITSCFCDGIKWAWELSTWKCFECILEFFPASLHVIKMFGNIFGFLGIGFSGL